MLVFSLEQIGMSYNFYDFQEISIWCKTPLWFKENNYAIKKTSLSLRNVDFWGCNWLIKTLKYLN